MKDKEGDKTISFS